MVTVKSGNRLLKPGVFIERAINIHRNRYDYSKAHYTGKVHPVTIICNKHGEFQQKPADHLNGCGCQKCGIETLSKKKSGTLESFLEKAKKRHKDKYDYSAVIYVDSRTKVTIICSDHGPFRQRANAHILGYGCPKCGDIRVSLHATQTQEEFISKGQKKHDGRYLYDKVDYVKANVKVIVTCLEHGDFKVTPNNHISKGAGCPRCNDSKGEKTIAKILDKYNIKYIREYKIPNQIYRFRYDFYLPEHKTLIEFHGIQHYEIIEFFGGEEGLSQTKQRDLFKKALAEEVRLRLVEINYKQFKFMRSDDFEKLLLHKLQIK